MSGRLVRWAVAICSVTWGLACNRLADSQVADAAPARSVVAKFLEAVRTGDDELAASLLTPLARRKTGEMEMVVAPPGSDTARFEIGASEQVGQCYHVSANWTDLDTDGRPHTDRIVWILRKEGADWRISGMATQVFADQQPIVLNFEDPGEMLRRQQQAEDEIARRDRQSEAQAHKSPPDEPSGAVR